VIGRHDDDQLVGHQLAAVEIPRGGTHTDDADLHAPGLHPFLHGAAVADLQ
jgi:hypothetical protein